MSTLPARPKASATTSWWAFFALLVFGVPVAILKAWVLQHLWHWFVVPTFHVPVPKIAVLYGLFWVVGLLWPIPKADDELTGKTAFTVLFTSVWMSMFGLLVGAIAHAFV